MIKRMLQWIQRQRKTVSFRRALRLLKGRYPMYLSRHEGHRAIFRFEGLGDVVEYETVLFLGSPTITALSIGDKTFVEYDRIPKNLLPID